MIRGLGAIGLIGLIGAINTIEAIDAIEAIETIDDIEAIDAIETIDAIDTIEAIENSEPTALACSPSSFTLTRKHDSLYYLNDLRLPYPVYRFCTADVDGDGNEDALVGVIKKTRFHREKGRRLLIFKQIEGKARPLWMGSKLGGTLQDFRVTENGYGTDRNYENYKTHRTHKTYKTYKTHETYKSHSPCTVRSLETTADGRYVVAEYQWENFGLAFRRFLVKNADQRTAMNFFKK